MLALQITSMKTFMNRLLVQDAFDDFLLEEASIATACTYSIDGHINSDFFAAEERENGLPAWEFQPWSEIKGLCFHLIKGKNTPLYFKFVLHLKPEKAAALLAKESSDADINLLKALVLTIRYDGTRAVLTTGTAFHTFVPGKDTDRIWDRAVAQYLSSCGVDCETL